MFSPAEINIALHQIWNREVTRLNLPVWVYLKFGRQFSHGVGEGFGSVVGPKYNKTDYESIKLLKSNVYLFSGAKTFNFVYDCENLLVEGNKILPFEVFKERAQSVGVSYCDTWLKTEYDTCIIQSKNCRDELSLIKNKEFFPMAKYVAFMDANTAEVCKQMNGYVGLIDDPIWKQHSPQQHYRCRCHKEPLMEGEAVLSKRPASLNAPNPLFAHNIGETKDIFNKHHPYFAEIPKEYRSFAKQNFNLPIPKL